MGKIRIKSFDESSEEDAKLKAKKEAKKAAKKAEKEAKKAETVEEVVEPETADQQPEEVLTQQAPVVSPETQEIEKETPKIEKKAKKEKFIKVRADSKRHIENRTYVSRTQNYNLDQALEALKKFKKAKFDETVELHINVKEKATSGQVTLPHGTGKTLVIKVADDAIIAEVEKGKINFDILVATPSMMPKLAKVARVLGPRGLMPNPKNGTISDNTDEAVKKLSAGQITYKTEPVAPIIHIAVGKVSFEDKQLKDNINTLLSSVGVSNIKSVILKSTMSPAIKLTV